MIVYLTRKEKFCAAHRLWVNEWSEDKNMEVFGNCANNNFHGHNYILSVTVKGEPDPLTGMIINAKDLGKLMREKITNILDHTNLNLDPSFLSPKLQTTTENLVVQIWNHLQSHLTDCTLHHVKLVETEKISAEYYGE